MAYPDFNPAQPPATRYLNRKYAGMDANSHHKRSRKHIKKFSKKFKESAVELLEGFGEKTTIHGLNRLLQRNTNKYERLFWLITFGIALFGTIYVCLLLSERFQAGTLQSIIQDTGRGVYRIAFPAITICNVNHLNWQRLQAAKEHFLPNETNVTILRTFELVIGLYDRITFGGFDVFSALQGEPIQLVENTNFTLVFDFMTWRCDELLAECVWRHRVFDCCEIFLKRRGKNGICWTFNTLETDEGRQRKIKDPKYPWHTGNGGRNSALRARVLVNPEKHFTLNAEKGVTVMIAEPSVWHRDPYFIAENTDTGIGIEPTIYFYDSSTRSLTPAQRQCFFSDERNNFDFKTLQGFGYMSENCVAECHQEYLVNYCNCSMDLLFPPGQHKPCRVTDLLCLARHNDYFRYTHQPGEEKYVRNTSRGMICKCFNNCYSLQYMTYVRPTFLPPDVRGNKSYVDLDIHFRSETMKVYCTNLVFSWIDLMVAFGGIAGLFLGCSLISAVEVFHFTFIELPVFAYTKLKDKRELKRCEILKNKTQAKKQWNSQDKKNQHHSNFKWFTKNRIAIADISRIQIKSNDNLQYLPNKQYY